MWRYIELLSFESLATVGKWKDEVEQGRNPRDIKVGFAQEIVARFHNAQAAEQALADFEARFKQGEIPADIPEFRVRCGAEPLPLIQILKQAGLTASTSEAMRMIDQGGVKLNGEKVVDKALSLPGGDDRGRSGRQAQIRSRHPRLSRITSSALTLSRGTPNRTDFFAEMLDRVGSARIMRGFARNGEPLFKNLDSRSVWVLWVLRCFAWVNELEANRPKPRGCWLLVAWGET